MYTPKFLEAFKSKKYFKSKKPIMVAKAKEIPKIKVGKNIFTF
jgi:hypothetical protein